MDTLYDSDATTDHDSTVDMYDDEEITQEDAWVVIDQYFEEKGLVSQQIDSFDEFIKYTIQELVQDVGEIAVTPEDQFIVGHEVVDHVSIHSSAGHVSVLQSDLPTLYVYFHFPPCGIP
jgi:DNA-directed RNA polymerase beta subunit